jgi:hypothetical protein
MVPFIVARYLSAPWLFLERFDPDTLHNMLVPINMDRPDDLLVTTTQLGLRLRGWTHCNIDCRSDECLCLFSSDVCCLVTFKGLKFLLEQVPLA